MLMLTFVVGDRVFSDNVDSYDPVEEARYSYEDAIYDSAEEERECVRLLRQVDRARKSGVSDREIVRRLGIKTIEENGLNWTLNQCKERYNLSLIPKPAKTVKKEPKLTSEIEKLYQTDNMDCIIAKAKLGSMGGTPEQYQQAYRDRDKHCK